MPPEPLPNRPSVDGRTLKRFAVAVPTVLLALLGLFAGWGLVPTASARVAVLMSTSVATPQVDIGLEAPSAAKMTRAPHERSDVLDVELRGEPEVGEDDAPPKRLAAICRGPFFVPQEQLRDRGRAVDETVTRFAVRSRRDARGADHRTIASSRGPPLAG